MLDKGLTMTVLMLPAFLVLTNNNHLRLKKASIGLWHIGRDIKWSKLQKPNKNLKTH